jgi:hypothetical protein
VGCGYYIYFSSAYGVDIDEGEGKEKGTHREKERRR